MATNRTAMLLFLSLTGAIVLAAWFLWPLLVALAVGMFPILNQECKGTALLGQIGDTYGSLNSLLTLVVGTVALLTLRTQQRQIREMNAQNIKGSALTLMSTYFALDPERDFNQRCRLLHSFILTVADLPQNIRMQFIATIHPLPKELERLKLDDTLSTHTWIPSVWRA